MKCLEIYSWVFDSCETKWNVFGKGHCIVVKASIFMLFILKKFSKKCFIIEDFLDFLIYFILLSPKKSSQPYLLTQSWHYAKNPYLLHPFFESLPVFPILMQDMVKGRKDIFSLFFSCPKANFGRSLTHPMLITALFLFQPKDYWEPHHEIESQSWDQLISKIRTRNLLIFSVMHYRRS